MASVEEELRREWAERFPSVPSDWPYWWIEGDGYLLAVIEGSNLSAAVDIVADYWSDYSSIGATTARSLDKDLVRGQNGPRTEISNRAVTQQTIDERQSGSVGEDI